MSKNRLGRILRVLAISTFGSHLQRVRHLVVPKSRYICVVARRLKSSGRQLTGICLPPLFSYLGGKTRNWAGENNLGFPRKSENSPFSSGELSQPSLSIMEVGKW